MLLLTNRLVDYLVFATMWAVTNSSAVIPSPPKFFGVLQPGCKEPASSGPVISTESGASAKEIWKPGQSSMRFL